MTFEDAVKIARGCHDYSGGYHDPKEWEIYHHGIQTVINALESVEKKGITMQSSVLHSIGSTVTT